MKLYADLPGRRTAQILADIGVLAWVCVWAWVGRFVHDATMELAAPGLLLSADLIFHGCWWIVAGLVLRHQGTAPSRLAAT